MYSLSHCQSGDAISYLKKGKFIVDQPMIDRAVKNGLEVFLAFAATMDLLPSVFDEETKYIGDYSTAESLVDDIVKSVKPSQKKIFA